MEHCHFRGITVMYKASSSFQVWGKQKTLSAHTSGKWMLLAPKTTIEKPYGSIAYATKISLNFLKTFLFF